MLRRLLAFWPLRFSLSASADTIVLNSGDSCSGRWQIRRVLLSLGMTTFSTLRAAKARIAGALDQAISEAPKTITAENAGAWFRHCGYAL